MSGFDWFLIGWWSLGIVLTPLFVGKPREPRTGKEAAIATGITFALIVCLLWTRGVLS